MKVIFKDNKTKDTLYVAYTGDENVVPQKNEHVWVGETKYFVTERVFRISEKSQKLTCTIWLEKTLLGF